MRLCTFLDGFAPSLGRVEGDVVLPLPGPDLAAVIRGAEPGPAGDPVPLDRVTLLPPLRPGKLIGIGLNFRDHAAETGATLPTEPLLFAKQTSSLQGATGTVVRPSWTDRLDYEGELAVVIGREARDVPRERALEHVFGYAAMNDVTARDRQAAEPQWVRAKGGDGFAPFGPWITTADEIGDPQALGIRTWVNGELRQDGNTREMVFGVAELIAWISASFTLEPGDVITTGTPAGVGHGMKPPVYLVPGDTVRVEVEGLGALEHAIG